MVSFIRRSTLRPIILAASRRAWRSASVKYAGTESTTSVTGAFWSSSAIFCIALSSIDIARSGEMTRSSSLYCTFTPVPPAPDSTIWYATFPISDWISSEWNFLPTIALIPVIVFFMFDVIPERAASPSFRSLPLKATMQADSRDETRSRGRVTPRRAIATTAFAWPMSMPMQDIALSLRTGNCASRAQRMVRVAVESLAGAQRVRCKVELLCKYCAEGRCEESLRRHSGSDSHRPFGRGAAAVCRTAEAGGQQARAGRGAAHSSRFCGRRGVRRWRPARCCGRARSWRSWRSSPRSSPSATRSAHFADGRRRRHTTRHGHASTLPGVPLRDAAPRR